MPLEPTLIRQQFPALDRQAIFLDNPGGTQISRHSLDRMVSYLTDHNANHGGAFATSIESDAILDEAHAAMADFLNASRPEEIIFGANMTTLTLHMSRSIARTWQAGDEIVVTRLDHDANITPWVLAAQDRGVKVRWVNFNKEEGTLDLDEMRAALQGNPRLLAVGYASNSLGTINPLVEIIKMAHQAGAWVYVDAVQYAPHGPIDVVELGCDFLVCSAYKFFGPHAGVVYGRYELLDELMAYKVRPASNQLPDKFETGTQNHEAIAGILGAIEYLEWLGKQFGSPYTEKYAARYQDRRLHLKQAMAAIRAYEYEISRAVLEVLDETPGVQLYGLRDMRRLDERVPTFSFTMQGMHPRTVAEKLAGSEIFVWDGNYYALQISEQLGLEEKGGMVRVGPVHYNTVDEVYQFGEAMRSLAASL